MNKPRRKQVQEVIDRLGVLQNEMDELISTIESIQEDEEEYRDNIPENMQGSERYERAETACDALMTARDTLEESKDSLDDVISSLEEAAE